MDISISIPVNLARAVARGKSLFQVTGDTVADSLENLCQILPKIKQKIYFDDGNMLQSSIEILVNKKSVNVKGPSIRLNDGDQIQIKRKIR